jgi:hypothetical protein
MSTPGDDEREMMRYLIKNMDAALDAASQIEIPYMSGQDSGVLPVHKDEIHGVLFGDREFAYELLNRVLDYREQPFRGGGWLREAGIEPPEGGAT